MQPWLRSWEEPLWFQRKMVPRMSLTGFMARIVRRPCASTGFSSFLRRLSCACARHSLPAAKAPCERPLSAVHASVPPRCCVIAQPIPLSSCGYGRGCCHVPLTCVSFLRRCLFWAGPDQLPPGAPWKALWPRPVLPTRRHVCLHECGGFLRARTRRPACWVICLRACPALRVPEFLFRASLPPCSF